MVYDRLSQVAEDALELGKGLWEAQLMGKGEEVWPSSVANLDRPRPGPSS